MRDAALVQTGKVSSINYEAGTVRVDFDDMPHSVSGELPMLSGEYKLPEIGEKVLCIFLSNNPSRGFCLGAYFQSKDPPQASGEGVFYKNFFGEAFIKYDKSTQTLTIQAPHVVTKETGGTS